MIFTKLLKKADEYLFGKDVSVNDKGVPANASTTPVEKRIRKKRSNVPQYEGGAGTGGKGGAGGNGYVPPSTPENTELSVEEKTELKEFRKEICKHCRGKGYATHQYGVAASADFPGDYSGIVKPVQIHIEFCICGRGKQLDRIIDVIKKETELDLTKRFYTSVKRRGDKGVSFEKMKEMFEGYWKQVLKVYKPLERG